MSREHPGFATRAVHVGQGPDLATGAVVQPIHLATTFAQEGIGNHGGFEYSRSNNPTREQLETCLASLEGGRHGLAFASGLAATTTTMLLLGPGDHVVYMQDAYGGTFRLFNAVMRRYGLSFTAVDATQPGAVEAAMTESTKLVWIETPTNPLLRIVDIAATADAAHRGAAHLAVDSTFASPYIQRPLELGADIVMHSSTKYLGGHSDVLGGCLVTSDDTLAGRLRFHQNAAGAVPSPFDCWLLLRGLKTLALRVQRQSDNALTIARHLQSNTAVRTVHYPGLPSHPQHQLAARQMGGVYGGVVSFELGDEEAAVRVLEALRLFTLAESLGAVESLAEHPGLMTHSSVPPDERARIGLGGGLLRLSVGIEDVDDLLADLDQALHQAS
ncbi:MAG: cystathionine gamma-synthase [Candidatus Dormibacteraeota bacterium]|uniref:Cystathionine gamma-synthase n=1 Tax=Candidatus Amunia macphersoniae TaxID=3127014 RepID=A0A934NF69_9BACT|nr:cystathionine gamma-synthase [Candidatus Dormibacteraeota bacterium]